jgi:hypothetical protein
MKLITTNPILGKKQCLFAALLLAAAPACLAQGVLAEYELTGSTPLAPTVVNVTSASSITFGGFAQAWTEPAPGVLQVNPGNTYTPALAVSGGNYATFTLTSSTPMDLTSLTIGGAYGIFSNPAGYVLESSVDGFGSYVSGAFPTQWGGSSSPTTGFSTETVSLTGAQFQNLTSISFEVFTYLQNGGDAAYNNFTVNGSLGAVPEPNTLALAGMGMMSLFGLKIWRRRA